MCNSDIKTSFRLQRHRIWPHAILLFCTMAFAQAPGVLPISSERSTIDTGAVPTVRELANAARARAQAAEMARNLPPQAPQLPPAPISLVPTLRATGPAPTSAMSNRPVLLSIAGKPGQERIDLAIAGSIYSFYRHEPNLIQAGWKLVSVDEHQNIVRVLDAGCAETPSNSTRPQTRKRVSDWCEQQLGFAQPMLGTRPTNGEGVPKAIPVPQNDALRLPVP